MARGEQKQDRSFLHIALLTRAKPTRNVNQDLKTNIIGKKRAINRDQLEENIKGFMKKRKADKPQVKKYFHHKHAKYAA